MDDKQFGWTLIIMGGMYFFGMMAEKFLTLTGRMIMFAGISLIYLVICGTK